MLGLLQKMPSIHQVAVVSNLSLQMKMEQALDSENCDRVSKWNGQ